MNQNQTPVKATTQEHLNIEDIQDDLVILKDGSVCLILQTSAVNFGLLSEPEQDATIYAYAGLLNSLTFPIQILIKNQRKDVTSYLKLLKNEGEKQKNPLLKEKITKYRMFIENTVRENNVLDKRFYIVIPFYSLEIGIKTSGFFKKGLPYPKSYILEKAKVSLNPKRDHLIRQFNRIGLKIEQLKNRSLIEMFFKIYNPESVGVQQISNSAEYEIPLVEAAIEKSLFNEKKTEPVPVSLSENSALPVSNVNQNTSPVSLETKPTSVLVKDDQNIPDKTVSPTKNSNGETVQVQQNIDSNQNQSQIINSN